MEAQEHMWCRWCGKSGITDLMVCSDSECLTKDMAQGALSEITGTFTIAGMSLTETTAKIKNSVSSRYSVLVAELAHDATPEDIFKHLTVT